MVVALAGQLVDHYRSISNLSPGSGLQVFVKSDLVEDVIVALAGQLVDHPGLLQEVGLQPGPADVEAEAEVDVDQLAEAAAVVVAQRLGVAEGLQQRVRGQDPLLDSRSPGQTGQILQQKQGSWVADEETLVFTLKQEQEARG